MSCVEAFERNNSFLVINRFVNFSDSIRNINKNMSKFKLKLEKQNQSPYCDLILQSQRKLTNLQNIQISNQLSNILKYSKISPLRYPIINNVKASKDNKETTLDNNLSSQKKMFSNELIKSKLSLSPSNDKLIKPTVLNKIKIIKKPNLKLSISENVKKSKIFNSIIGSMTTNKVISSDVNVNGTNVITFSRNKLADIYLKGTGLNLRNYYNLDKKKGRSIWESTNYGDRYQNPICVENKQNTDGNDYNIYGSLHSNVKYTNTSRPEMILKGIGENSKSLNDSNIKTISRKFRTIDIKDQTNSSNKKQASQINFMNCIKIKPKNTQDVVNYSKSNNILISMLNGN